MAYTSKTNLLSVQKRQRQCCWSEKTGERDAADRALFKLVGYVQSRILDESKIISMAQIEGKFQQYLEEIGQERYPFHRDKLKTKLSQYFAGKIEFCRRHVSSKPDLVYSSSLMKGQLIEACVNHMTTDAEDIDYRDLAAPYVTASYANLQSDGAMALLHSAQDVRSAVRTMRNTMVWPPSLEDLQGTFEEFVPTLLYNFLALTLVGEDKCSIDVHNMHTEKATVEDTIHRRIL